MSYSFRRAIASEAKPLIGLYAESGCGKTKSALLLAKGFTGDMAKVGMIETESGRGEAFADDPIVGGYQVLPLRESFSPANYGKAIAEAERAGLSCLIVDSASHEWEGVGGVLAMAAENQAAGKKGPIVWQKPKLEHGREFMLRLLQSPIPLVIVCMRAKYPMVEVVRNSQKEWTRSDKLEPKQAADILFEMFVHGWIDEGHRFHGTKYTVDALRKALVDNEIITVGSGERLAAWASGRSNESAAQTSGSAQAPAPSSSGERASASAGPTISEEQIATLERMCTPSLLSKLKEKVGVSRLVEIKTADFDRCVKWIKAHPQGETA
jgi:hypothetical protein